MAGSEYYNHTTYPSVGAAGSSGAMRAELELIEAGFGKLVDLSGNGNKLIKVNAGATGQAASIISDDGSTVTVGGALTVTGAITLSSALPVAQGGTGRTTGTTAYGLIAAGTTATGAQQTLAAGATTEILVGGGASALPVWTTATGSGSPVRATSPTLETPTIGVASATSINKVAFTAPATGCTLTIADGKTLTASNTLTLTGTDGSSVAFGTGGTVLYSGGALGTPASGTLTNCSGLPLTSGVTGALPIANGGTGSASAADARTALGVEAAQTAASQAEAEAGTEAAIRSFSPLRVRQAINATQPSGSFTATASSGFTTTPTATWTWAKAGSAVTMTLVTISGTSNSTGFTISGIPAAIIPSDNRSVVVRVSDNGGAVQFGLMTVQTDGTATITKDAAGSAFTNSGAKSLNSFTVAYTL